MIRPGRQRVFRVIFAVVLLGSAGAGLAAAPPSPPAAYYGNVTLNGEPAPAGTTVTALVDGERRGSLRIETAGTYGGPGAFDRKLRVNGSAGDEGATVTFRVTGVDAEQTVTWRPGDTRRVDLVATGELDTGPEDGGTTDTGGESGPTASQTAGPDPESTPSETGGLGFNPLSILLGTTALIAAAAGLYLIITTWRR